VNIYKELINSLKKTPVMTKEERKQLRLQFWLEFDLYSIKKKKRLRKPLKWIMNNTNIKQLKLKFDFDENRAIVGMEVETRNLDKRIIIYEKIENLKTAIESALGQPLIWEIEHILPNGKSISRAYLELKDVSIYRSENWQNVMDFFYKNMLILEKVFEKNKDFLKYGNEEE
jgi:hypothetical protein